MIPVSILDAKKYFEQWTLPRRKRDHNAEEVYFQKHGKHKKLYRRVEPNETERGKLYPLCTTGLRLLAHFGVGIGIYFMQLLILAGVALVAGLILLPLFIAYKRSENGNSMTNKLLSISGVCPSAISVNATIDCPNGESFCDALYRENCSLPHVVVISDLTMSIFVLSSIFLSIIVENKLQEKLDEAVQSAQDYSVVVTDPDPDAIDPDEWYHFFSRFGKVKYVTVTKKNRHLGLLLAKRHVLWRRIKAIKRLMPQVRSELSDIEDSNQDALNRSYELKESANEAIHNENTNIDENIVENTNSASNLSNWACSCSISWIFTLCWPKEISKNWEKQLSDVDKLLEEEYKKDFPANHVYITFETEDHQRLALQELEVPDVAAMFDYITETSSRTLFRGKSVLDVREPPEPDNIIWGNCEYSLYERARRKVLSRLFTFAILVMCYFAVKYFQDISSSVLSVIVGIIDAILPTLFQLATHFEAPTDEGRMQESLQIKLFGIRLLLSTIFPFINKPWESLVDVETARQILDVQFAACFSDPLQKLLDLPSIIGRNIVGPLLAGTQEELNGMWSGSGWTLAERYTGLSKILFVSLFYSMLTPISLFISSLAFILIFLIDRFLLLRRWEVPAMMDAQVASRLRQQAILSVTAHMYITCLFINSWPMDQAYLDSDTGEYIYASKRPSWNILTMNTREPWMSGDLSAALYAYKISTIIVLVLAFGIWILFPTVKLVNRLFFRNIAFVGQSMGIPFSNVSRIFAYVPTVYIGKEKVIFADTRLMLEQHKPKLVSVSVEDTPDISFHVPISIRDRVLSVVKWYDDAPDMKSFQVSAMSDTKLMHATMKTSLNATMKATNNPVDSLATASTPKHKILEYIDSIRATKSLTKTTNRSDFESNSNPFDNTSENKSNDSIHFGMSIALQTIFKRRSPISPAAEEVSMADQLNEPFEQYGTTKIVLNLDDDFHCVDDNNWSDKDRIVYGTLANKFSKQDIVEIIETHFSAQEIKLLKKIYNTLVDIDEYNAFDDFKDSDDKVNFQDFFSRLSKLAAKANIWDASQERTYRSTLRKVFTNILTIESTLLKTCESLQQSQDTCNCISWKVFVAFLLIATNNSSY